MVAGVVAIVVGVCMVVWPGLFGKLGKLPGDVSIQRDGFTFSFPIVTCILVSILLTAIFYLVGVLRR